MMLENRYCDHFVGSTSAGEQNPNKGSHCSEHLGMAHLYSSDVQLNLVVLPVFSQRTRILRAWGCRFCKIYLN